MLSPNRVSQVLRGHPFFFRCACRSETAEAMHQRTTGRVPRSSFLHCFSQRHILWLSLGGQECLQPLSRAINYFRCRGSCLHWYNRGTPTLQSNAYYRHLEEFVRQMYPLDEAFMLSVLAPKTTYPHVSPTAMLELSDANRRPTRRTPMVHTGGAGASTLASSNRR